MRCMSCGDAPPGCWPKPLEPKANAKANVAAPIHGRQVVRVSHHLAFLMSSSVFSWHSPDTGGFAASIALLTGFGNGNRLATSKRRSRPAQPDRPFRLGLRSPAWLLSHN